MDEPTFELLYARTVRPLWSYIHRVSGDAALADDILQETYYRFLRSPKPYASEAQMKSYLYKIATNLLNDHWRDRKREQRHHSADDTENAATDDPARRHDMAQALEQLSPRQRSLLWLAYVEGNEHREIARILGLEEKSVRVLLFRARQRLAGILKRKDSGQKA